MFAFKVRLNFRELKKNSDPSVVYQQKRGNVVKVAGTGVTGVVIRINFLTGFFCEYEYRRLDFT